MPSTAPWAWDGDLAPLNLGYSKVELLVGWSRQWSHDHERLGQHGHVIIKQMCKPFLDRFEASSMQIGIAIRTACQKYGEQVMEMVDQAVDTGSITSICESHTL